MDLEKKEIREYSNQGGNKACVFEKVGEEVVVGGQENGEVGVWDYRQSQQ